MALNASKKDVILNAVYSLGAAVVILGALCKINHYEPLGISGSTILAIGLGVEALIFVIFALDKPSGEYKWEKVYPELTDGIASGASSKGQDQVEAVLSKKLDKLMADAKLDVALFDKLKVGIDGFKQSVDNISSSAVSTGSTQKYADQLSLAANHMESLNAMYLQQLEEGEKSLEFNKQMMKDLKKSSERSAEFTEQMNGLTQNLANLNNVYGNMLSAMKGGKA